MIDDMRDAPATPYGMTDLEERLRADGGEFRAAILSRLAQLGRDIDGMVGRGLAPGEFHRAQAIRGAVVAARNFLTMRTPASSLKG